MLLPIRRWRDITGYEGLYQISNLGDVRSLNYGGIGETRILKLSTNKDGYKNVYLYKDRKRSCYKVHRLVAQAFIPNPNGLPQVNHKDEDKTNNIWTNLEWCDCKYNTNYGTRNKRISKPIKCITTGEIFNSTLEASRHYNMTPQNIRACLKGRTRYAGKDLVTGEPLLWKYID